MDASPPRPDPPSPTLEAHLRAEPFTLLLGAGFFGFFAHLGLVEALLERGLAPRRACGVSAGAIVAAAVAAGRGVADLEDRLLALRREDFWDPFPGLGLLRGRRFRALLAEVLGGAPTFEELPTPLSVTAYDPLRRRLVVLERGPLIDAVVASCAVPFLFHPVRLDGHLLWDGGVRERSGVSTLAPGERAFHHHLVSTSPWRRKGSPSAAVPEREGLVALAIEGLPRLGPFHLEAGPKAIEQAYAATRLALDGPVAPVIRARARA